MYLEAKIMFIRKVVTNEIQVSKMRKVDLEGQLILDAYPRMNASYDYILRIPIYNLTIDKVEELENEYQKAQDEINAIKGTTEQSMWIDELNAFEQEYEKYIATYDIDSSSSSSKKTTKKK